MADSKDQTLPSGASQALQACAKLFGVALAVDDCAIADRLRKLMFDLWEQRHDNEAISLLVHRLEQAMYPPQPTQQTQAHQFPVGTGATGMMGGTGPQNAIPVPTGQPYAPPAHTIAHRWRCSG